MQEVKSKHTQIYEGTDDIFIMMAPGLEAANSSRSSSLIGIELPSELEILLYLDENFEPRQAKDRLYAEDDMPLYGDGVIKTVFEYLPEVSPLSQILTIESICHDLNSSKTIAMSYNAIFSSFSEYEQLPDNMREMHSSLNEYLVHLVTEREGTAFEDREAIREKSLLYMAQYTRTSALMMAHLGRFMMDNPYIGPSAIACRNINNLYKMLHQDLTEFSMYISGYPDIREAMGVEVMKDGNLAIRDGFMSMVDTLDDVIGVSDEVPTSTILRGLRVYLGDNDPMDEILTREIDEDTTLFGKHFSIHQSVDSSTRSYLMKDPANIRKIARLTEGHPSLHDSANGIAFALRANRLTDIEDDAIVDSLASLPAEQRLLIIHDLNSLSVNLVKLSDSYHTLDNFQPRRHDFGDTILREISVANLMSGVQYAIEKRVAEIIAMIGSVDEDNPAIGSLYTKGGKKDVPIDNKDLPIWTIHLMGESIKAITETMQNPSETVTGTGASRSYSNREAKMTTANAAINVRNEHGNEGGMRLGFTIRFPELSDEFLEASRSVLRSVDAEDTINTLGAGSRSGRKSRVLNFRLDYEDDGSLSVDIGSSFKPKDQPLGFVIASVFTAAAQLRDLERDNHVREFHEKVRLDREEFARRLGSLNGVITDRL